MTIEGRGANALHNVLQRLKAPRLSREQIEKSPRAGEEVSVDCAVRRKYRVYDWWHRQLNRGHTLHETRFELRLQTSHWYTVPAGSGSSSIPKYLTRDGLGAAWARQYGRVVRTEKREEGASEGASWGIEAAGGRAKYARTCIIWLKACAGCGRRKERGCRYRRFGAGPYAKAASKLYGLNATAWLQGGAGYVGLRPRVVLAYGTRAAGAALALSVRHEWVRLGCEEKD
ncbi:hypothetical protein C8F01DRAFT_1085272 [Mycena amicta]|nr:hypothetical protein C8F01DRAFT_1085272 [Mycena amicta]